MEQVYITEEQSIVEYITDQQSEKEFILEEWATLSALFIVRWSEQNLHVIARGKGAKAHITCLFLSKDGEISKAKVQATLWADQTTADVYLLSFLWDKAEVHVDGGVTIAQDTKGASGHLLEENIVLGKKVKVKTLPMLDVRSSDVSASHGAKIDRLDEWKLFYMMAKGLDQKQAQRLIVEGYIQRACEGVNMDNEDEKSKVIKGILAYLGME